MGRDNTIAREMMRDLCYTYHMEEKTVFDKAALLLKAYRKICYSSYLDDDNVADLDSEDKALVEAVCLLENFEPGKVGQSLVRDLRDRNVKSWIIQAIESAMIKVQEFPEMGRLYFDILTKRFIVQIKYAESDISGLLCLERSRYYDHRYEATVVFGVCLWGSVLPKMKKEAYI